MALYRYSWVSFFAWIPGSGTFFFVFGSQTGYVSHLPWTYFASPHREEFIPPFRLALLQGFEHGLQKKKTCNNPIHRVFSCPNVFLLTVWYRNLLPGGPGRWLISLEWGKCPRYVMAMFPIRARKAGSNVPKPKNLPRYVNHSSRVPHTKAACHAEYIVRNEKKNIVLWRACGHAGISLTDINTWSRHLVVFAGCYAQVSQRCTFCTLGRNQTTKVVSRGTVFLYFLHLRFSWRAVAHSQVRSVSHPWPSRWQRCKCQSWTWKSGIREGLQRRFVTLGHSWTTGDWQAQPSGRSRRSECYKCKGISYGETTRKNIAPGQATQISTVSYHQYAVLSLNPWCAQVFG